MKALHRSLILPVVALLLWCVNLAGPGGEGNGSETIARGIIADSMGTPVAGVPVQLLPADHNPVAPDTIPAGWRAFTNSRGEYHLNGIGSGSYVLEASSISMGQKALVRGIELSGKKSEVVLDTGRLGKTGAVLILLSEVDARVGDYIYLPGTSTYTIISRSDSLAGRASLNSVPAGAFSELIYKNSADSQATDLLTGTMTVQPGDTVVAAYAAWKYSRRIRLNTTASGADVTGDVLDFPVLLRLSGSSFVFSQALAGGEDIRFTSSTGSPLSYEIERWDPVAERAEVWVNVDTVFGNNSTQTFTMYWGNTRATGNSYGAAVFDTANGFTGVWHMDENPGEAGGAIKDRTGNAHHAASSGAMSASNVVSGAIGKALSFDGIDDYLNAGDVSIPGAYSIGLWVKLDTVEKSQRFIYKDSSYTLWYAHDTTHSVRVEHMSATEWWQGLLQDGGTRVPMVAGVWYYLVGTFDKSRIVLYANGVEVSRSNGISALPVQTPSRLFFGRYRNTIDFVKGIMDEIRIEGTARSPDWIRLCYMNQRPDDRLVEIDGQIQEAAGSAMHDIAECFDSEINR